MQIEEVNNENLENEERNVNSEEEDQENARQKTNKDTEKETNEEEELNENANIHVDFDNPNNYIFLPANSNVQDFQQILNLDVTETENCQGTLSARTFL